LDICSSRRGHPRTFTEKTKQSEEIARINAPLLKNFLKRLEDRLPIELSQVEAAPYLLEYLERI